MFGLVVLPAALVTAGRFFTPQSPHWLLTRGRVTEAEDALARILQVRVRSRQACGWMPSQPVNEYRRATLTCSDTTGRYGRRFSASAPWFLQDLSTYGIGIFTPVIIANRA